MEKLLLKILIFFLLLITVFNGCKEDDPINDPVDTTSHNDTITIKEDFAINITSSSNHRGIRAFVFLNDSFYGKANQNGDFSIKTLKSGSYWLVVSAINYRDTSMQITKLEQRALNFNFVLINETTTGRIYGEFQDLFTFRQKLLEKPELNTWDEKAKFDGVTGATMQKKSYSYLAERQIYVNDEKYKITDEFGQYWFDMQCGTYKLTGLCDGYRMSPDTVIKVMPGEKIYLNFYLERN